jgi:ABC-type transport system substrate-binding protein
MKKIFAALVVLLLAHHSVGAQTPKPGGKIVFALEADVSTMNPFVRMLSTDELMRSLMYETLFNFDLKEKIVPSLGESWTISKDGLEYIVKLRQGVKFHNGQEVTPDDVKWSVEYAMDAKNGASGFSLLKPVESITVVDKTQIRFKLKEATAPFLSTLASIRGFIVVPKNSVPQGAKTIPAFPPGTGPFAFKAWETGVQTVLVRHKDYWQKGLPYLDEVVFKPVEDATVRLSSLRAGDVQIIERTPYTFVAKIKSGELGPIRVVEAKSAGFKRLIFNVQQPPFDNPALRLAVAHAIDKKQYLQGAFWSFGSPVDQRYPAGTAWFVKMPERVRDVAKVKAAFKDAGVSDIEIELLGQQGDETEQQILQQQLSSAGIKTKIRLMEYGSYVERQTQRDWQMIIFGGRMQPDPHLIYGVEYTCAEAEQAKAKRSTRNLAGYCNKEVDKLIAEAGRITDSKKRYELYAKVIRQIGDDVIEVTLGFYPRFYALSDKVKDFVPDDTGSINGTQFGIVKTWLER